jgi:hypothetical protein
VGAIGEGLRFRRNYEKTSFAGTGNVDGVARQDE